MRRKFRADIQFLRSLAIGFVLLNHLVASVFPGGYIGVDIFFVISGYLIIGHITDAVRAGRFSFKHFYIKRAWRILPAAWVTLVVTFILAQFIVPIYQAGDIRPGFIASWFYYQNFQLMSSGADYFSTNKALDIYEHFWSLAVEEQFYIVTPLALFFAYKWVKKARLNFNSSQFIMLVVGVLSFIYALHNAYWDPSPGNYFSTGARLWEFTIGGFIYMLPQFNKWLNLNRVVIYSCYTILLISLFALTPDYIFPGPATLVPVLCTAAIIYFGSSNPDRPFESIKPFQYIGAISYPLYLWHLPVILLLPFSRIPIISSLDENNKLTIPAIIGAVLISVGLAHITLKYIERPLQQRPLLQLVKPTLIALLSSSLVIVGLWGLQPAYAQWKQQKLMAKSGDQSNACQLGSPIKNLEATCPQAFSEPVKAAPAATTFQPYIDAGCTNIVNNNAVGKADCNFGEPGSADLFVTGDSHASMWSASYVQLAKQLKMNLKVIEIHGCAFVDHTGVTSDYKDEERDIYFDKSTSCLEYDKEAMNYLTQEKPKHVIISNFTRNQFLTPTDQDIPDSYEDRRTTSDPLMKQRILERGHEVLDNTDTVTYIKNPPLDVAKVSAKCVDYNTSDPAACETPVTSEMQEDPQIDWVKTISNPSLSIVDMDEYICGEKCVGAVNGTRVYMDTDHLNTDYTKTFAGPMANQLQAAMGL